MTRPAVLSCGSLRRYVRQYRLNLGGSVVWAPYWINRNKPPFWLNAPSRGKGTWRELGLAARAAARNQKTAPPSAEAWRVLMRGQGLGIDCSGFVYHVLDGWLQDGWGMRLADGLFIRQAEIEERNARVPALARCWDGHEVHNMTLGSACRYWMIDPAPLVDVKRLTDEAVAQPVLRTCDMRAGDLIRTSIGDSLHIGVVVRVGSGVIEYADSADDRGGGLGGVSVRKIRVVAPELGLEAQDWEQNRMYHPARAGSGDGVWRLKIVDEVGQ